MPFLSRENSVQADNSSYVYPEGNDSHDNPNKDTIDEEDGEYIQYAFLQPGESQEWEAFENQAARSTKTNAGPKFEFDRVKAPVRSTSRGHVKPLDSLFPQQQHETSLAPSKLSLPVPSTFNF